MWQKLSSNFCKLELSLIIIQRFTLPWPVNQNALNFTVFRFIFAITETLRALEHGHSDSVWSVGVVGEEFCIRILTERLSFQVVVCRFFLKFSNG